MKTVWMPQIQRFAHYCELETKDEFQVISLGSEERLYMRCRTIFPEWILVSSSFDEKLEEKKDSVVL